MSFLPILTSSVRFFVFQCKDMATLPELQAGYTTALLVDVLGMNPDNITIQSCYPYKKFFNQLVAEIDDYPEENFFFFLENYYHSSTYADKEIEHLLRLAPNKRVYIQSAKMTEYDSIQLMNKFPHIAMVIRTDPEYVLYCEVVGEQPVKDIANITYRLDGVPTSTRNEPVEYDLADYIFPAYTNGKLIKEKDTADEIGSFVDEDDETTDRRVLYSIPRLDQLAILENSAAVGVAMLASGRGCKYKCSYCFRGVKYSSVRQIPLSVIESDLAYLKSIGYNYIYFYDDCFVTTNKDRLAEIVDLMQKYNFAYYIAIRYEACTPEILNMLAKLRFYKIQIGLQSVTHNAAHKRSFNHEKLVSAVSILNRSNCISIDLILGLPGEGKADFVKTLEYAISLKPKTIVVNTLFLNPGTELSTTFSKFGIKVNSSVGLNVPYIIESDTFSKEDLVECREMLKGLVDELKDINFVIR